MVTKYGRFVSRLENVVSGLDTVTVKSAIGDSIYNNRTLTVSQLIRFLETSEGRGHAKLASNLRLAYNTVRPSVFYGVRFFNNRTDAIDVSELIHTLGSAESSIVRSIGRRLA